jgi:hypothetical protein
MGPAAAAQLAVERIHGTSSEFVLHFDVDVIADFQATNYPGSSGLSLEDARAALEVFARQKHLAAIEVTAYNPGKDPDGSGAKLILDLLAGILEVRLAALQGSEAPSQSGTESAAQISPAPAEPTVAAPAALGEAGSSDSLAESQVDDGPAVIEKADESSS